MVVGNSIVKKVKGWELSTKNDLFVVRSFPGAKTDDMESYIKPTLKIKPKRIIIHCRTNDLKNKKPQSIADIINCRSIAQSISDTVTSFLYLPLFPGKII